MSYDVSRIRKSFPALEYGVAHFDGPGGSQTPQQVAYAVAQALVSGVSNRGRITAAEQRADDTVLGARAAVGDDRRVKEASPRLRKPGQPGQPGRESVWRVQGFSSARGGSPHREMRLWSSSRRSSTRPTV